VLDLRSFESEAAKKEFLLDFARRIYQRNEAPLHLFLEEADDYIPQKPMREEAHLLRAWENIVRRGRSRGLGMTMITQRSASLNKNVLTQAQTLIAMRTTGPQDRKAIEEWVKYNDQSLDILESLAGLEDGEAWVWSPQFLKVTKRVQFRRRRTFDSGSTPKMAAKGKTATLADIDVSSLRVRMADTIERAAADDPKALKARIRELEAAAKRAPSVAPAHAAPRDRASEHEQSRRIAALERNNAALKEYSEQLFAGVALSQTIVDELEEKVRALRAVRFPRSPKLVDVVPSSALVARTVTPAPARQPTVAPAPRPARTPRPASVDGSVDNVMLKILNSIAWLESIGNRRPENSTVAFIAGYSNPRSGGYANPRGRLSVAGLINYADGSMELTDAGRALTTLEDAPTSNEELHEQIYRRLNSDGPMRKILKTLIDVWPESMTNEQLAAMTGYSNVRSGGFANPRGRLSSLGLISYKAGVARASDNLFPLR
jgi:hypothetical protein